MSNIVTGKLLNEEEIKFLLCCVQRGTSLYEDFKKTRFEDKSLNLLDKIPKSRKSKKLSSKLPKVDVKKKLLRQSSQSSMHGYEISAFQNY